MDEIVVGSHDVRLQWPEITVDYAWLPPWEGWATARPNRVKVVFSGHDSVAVEHEGVVHDVEVRPGGAYLVGAEGTRRIRITEYSDTLDMYPDMTLLVAEAQARGIGNFAIAPTLQDDAPHVFGINPTFLGLAHLFRRACVRQIALSDIEASTLGYRLINGILDV